jgi:hypothetical protein
MAKAKHSFERHSERLREEFSEVCDDVIPKLRRKLEGIALVTRGLQYKRGYCTGKLAIRLEVPAIECKRLLKRFLSEIGLQRRYGKFPLDIVVRHYRLAQAEGDGIETQFETGSLGVLVAKNLTNDPVWFTAAHVISDRDSTTRPSYPPADVSVGDGTDDIGVVPGSPSYYRCNDLVDCALIVPNNSGLVPAGDGMSSDGLAENMPVKKVGNSTHATSGNIESIDASSHTITDHTGHPITVTDHFYVLGVSRNGTSAPFADFGDSGAAVRLADGSETIIGIVRAVEPGTGITVVSKISTAASRLQFH